MDFIEIVAQALGFVGTLFMVLCMQQKKYDRIMLCKVLNELFFAIHYVLLGAYTGVCMNSTACVANGVYWYKNKKDKSPVIFQIIFSIVFVVLGILSWQGPVSAFIIVAKIIANVAFGINNPRAIRVLNFICLPCYLTYNICMGSLSGILSDSLSIISVVVGIVRFDILNKKDVKV